MKISKGAAYGLHATMFMVRHMTQLPMTAEDISKAEGIPAKYLTKILHRLAQAGLIKSSKGSRGYNFFKNPKQISLLQLFEAIERKPLFQECCLKHCECSGTPETCIIYAHWTRSTKQISKLFRQTSIEAAAWNHPEHRFYEFSKFDASSHKRNSSKSKASIRKGSVTKR